MREQFAVFIQLVERGKLLAWPIVRFALRIEAIFNYTGL
jgi:hypothetical protein